jgi:hypothetical protein
MTSPISRRSVLRGTGVALALPLLEAMLPSSFTRSAHAAANPALSQRRRMVAICATLGLHGPNLVPEQAGFDYKPTPYTEPFQKQLRNDVSVVSGLSHPDVDGGHSAEFSFLTAAPHPGSPSFRNTISLDQYMADRIGAETRFASLSLNTSNGGAGSLSYTQSGVVIPGDGSPSKVFARLFLVGSAKEVAAQVHRLKEGQSVMDTINAQAAAMARSLGHGDRDKLDEYFTSVRELEQRLVKAESWSKKPKPVVDVQPPKDITDRSDLIGCTKLMYDLIHLAFQTDSTRVVTLKVEGLGLVPKIAGVTEAHHALSHHGRDPHKIEQLTLVERAEMDAFAEFLGKLRETKEEGSNLLDRSMVYYGANMGNASSHDNRNMPVILAGGGFKHGQHLAFDQKNNTPLCNMYLSMLQRMGIEADSFASGHKTLKGLEFKEA